jgi:hypothetical protein
MRGHKRHASRLDERGTAGENGEGKRVNLASQEEEEEEEEEEKNKQALQ